MGESEEDQRYARLCSDLRADAEACLTGPLNQAGATPGAASEACVEIAASIAAFLVQESGDHYPFDEIGEVRKTLVELEAKLSHLSLAANLLMQDSIWDEEEMPSLIRAGTPLSSPVWLEIMAKHNTWQAFQLFREALPVIVESLPATPPRKGGHDSRRHSAVEAAIGKWRKATGQFPPATKDTDENRGTAPLLVFLQSHMGSRGLSADSFRRIINGLKGLS